MIVLVKTEMVLCEICQDRLIGDFCLQENQAEPQSIFKQQNISCRKILVQMNCIFFD